MGWGPEPAIIGLVLSCAVAAAGVWAAALWHRLGDVRLAVNLCGVAGLLASPVSWLHHFVWVVPLAMSLLERRPVSPRSLPFWYLVLGWLFVGWVVVAPFMGLPNGADVELQWSWSQHLLASITTVVGLALLAGAIIIARPRVQTIFARLDSKRIASPSRAGTRYQVTGTQCAIDALVRENGVPVGQLGTAAVRPSRCRMIMELCSRQWYRCQEIDQV